MNKVVNFFSDNQMVEALANGFGVLAGAVVVWNVAKFTFKFCKNIYQNNFLFAVRSFRNSIIVWSITSARDIHLFLSRVSLFLIIVNIGFAGILISIMSSLIQTESYLREKFNSQKLFSNFETYVDFHKWFELISSFSLMAMMIFSFSLSVTHIRIVQRLRKRWQRRRRLP